VGNKAQKECSGCGSKLKDDAAGPAAAAAAVVADDPAATKKPRVESFSKSVVTYACDAAVALWRANNKASSERMKTVAMTLVFSGLVLVRF
jgi:hypothetical protein